VARGLLLANAGKGRAQKCLVGFIDHVLGFPVRALLVKGIPPGMFEEDLFHDLHPCN
jgi:hypothetical protein